MTKILVCNFPKKSVSISAIGVDNDKEKVRFHVGYDHGNNFEQIIENTLSSLFLSLIVHDDIYIKFDDFYLLLDKIGLDDTIKILERKILKIVDVKSDNAIWEYKSQPGKLSLGGVTMQLSAMERFERAVEDKNDISRNKKSFLIQYTDNATLEPPKGFDDLRSRELENDLKKNVFSSIGVETTSTEDVCPQDALKLLRIADTTDRLLLQHSLGLDSIVQDGFVKQYLNLKAGPLISSMHKDTLSAFSNIASLKGIPDIYNLYRHKTITMDNILACRESVHGGIFRQWYTSTDYDEQKVLRALVEKGASESVLQKVVRIIYPNVIGLISPMAGLVADAVDSFIVGRLLEGWNPSLFLDNVLKTNIDKQIAISEENEKRNKIIKRFGKVDRNSLCPCQSGKKFKHCHGV